MNLNISNAPVIIVGFPRSGTTLLLHILLSSGVFSTYDFSETHFFSHYFRRYGSLTNKKNKIKFLESISKSDWLTSSSITLDQLIERAKPKDNDYGSYFTAFMSLTAEQDNKTRWVEKTPYHMLYIPEINHALPKAKYILVVRDPRDSVLSVLSYGWSGGLFGGFAKVAAAWDWHTNTTRKLLDKEKVSYITVKYEDLTSNTENTLCQISDFLSINLNLDELNKDGVGVLQGSNSSHSTDDSKTTTKSRAIKASGGRWKNKVPINEIQKIEYITRNTLYNYGYTAFTTNKLNFFTKRMMDLLVYAYASQKIIRRILFPIVRR